MRIIFLTDKSPGWIYVVNRIYPRFAISQIVFLRHSANPRNRRERIKRKLKQRGFIKLLDFVAVSFVKHLMHWDEKHKNRFSRYLDDRGIEYSNQITEIPEVYIKDINDDESVDVIKSLNPDIVIYRASPILSKKIFEIPKIAALNIHFGIIPEYRSGGNFYAIRNNDFQNLGVSVHCIDKGIDTGSLLCQERIVLDANDDFGTIEAKTLILGTELLMEILEYIEKHNSFRIKDTSNRISEFYWSQYGLSDYLIARKNLKKHIAVLS